MTDDDKIEYEPHDDPDYDVETDDTTYHVHVYPNDQTIVPDVIVWTRTDDELFRLWGFQGHNGLLVLTLTTVHRHPPDYEDEPCEKWSLYQDDPFPPLEDAPAMPGNVSEIAVEAADAPLADKTQTEADDE